MFEKPIIFSQPMIAALIAHRKRQTRRLVNIDALDVRVRGTVHSDMPDTSKTASGRVHVELNKYGAVSAQQYDGEGLLGLKPNEFDFICPYCECYEGQTRLVDLGRTQKVWTIIPKVSSSLWVREPCRIWWDGGSVGGVVVEYKDGTTRKVRGFGGRMSNTCVDGGPLADKTQTDAKWRSPIHMPRDASRIVLGLDEVRLERLQDITEANAREEGVPDEAITTTDCGGTCTICDPVCKFAHLWDKINGKKLGATYFDNPFVWVLTFRPHPL